MSDLSGPFQKARSKTAEIGQVITSWSAGGEKGFKSRDDSFGATGNGKKGGKDGAGSRGIMLQVQDLMKVLGTIALLLAITK
jgi:hypothetical protein